MENSKNKASKHTNTGTGPAVFILRAVIAGAASFAAGLLLFPLLLMQTEEPETFIPAAAVVIIALTAFSAGFAASKGNNKHFLFTGIISALSVILILIIFALSSKETGDKNYIFTAILYAVVTVFSILGAKVASKNPKKSRRRR